MAHHPLAILAQKRDQRGEALTASLRGEQIEHHSNKVLEAGFFALPVLVGASVFTYGRSQGRSDLLSFSAALVSSFTTLFGMAMWAVTGRPEMGLPFPALGVGVPVWMLKK
jgi:hypothetical protein